MRIWAFHLLNDYSGSPLMLKNTLKALEDHAEIYLWTSESKGFLSGLNSCHFHPNSYSWSKGKLGLLLKLIQAQLEAFFLVLRNRKKIDVVYINTLLPAGAALAAKLLAIPVIYHLHEPQLNNRFLFRLLKAVAIGTADKAVFVSSYLQRSFPELTEKGQVIPNVLSEDFLQRIVRSEISNRKSILMLCSFKPYKGIEAFASLAKTDPARPYCLILNAPENQIQDFRQKHREIKNLSIESSPADLHPLYQEARILLNLSHPDSWIESFGMTALEGMAYGLPCIVPEVGGIAELVNEASGFKCSVFELDKITRRIDFLLSDDRIYIEYSRSALQRSQEYAFPHFKAQLLSFMGFAHEFAS